MSHWLRSLVTCLSLTAFLVQNASALGACPHHGARMTIAPPMMQTTGGD